MHHQHAQQVRRLLGEAIAGAFGLARRQVPLHRHVIQVVGHRTRDDAIGGEHTAQHRAVHDQRRRQLAAEVAGVLLVLGGRADHVERCGPPLHVMVAGHHDRRRESTHGLHKLQRALELAVSRTLGEVACDRHGRRCEVGRQSFQSGDLSQVGISTEVQVGALQDGGSAHQVARTR